MLNGHRRSCCRHVMDGSALPAIDALPNRNAISKAPRAAGYRGSDFVLWHKAPVRCSVRVATLAGVERTLAGARATDANDPTATTSPQRHCDLAGACDCVRPGQTKIVPSPKRRQRVKAPGRGTTTELRKLRTRANLPPCHAKPSYLCTGTETSRCCSSRYGAPCSDRGSAR